MSWWVKDFQSISEDSSEALVNIQCDAAADLPAADQTGTAGYTIVRGSKALDLATGDRYIMNSSGSWVKQPSEYQLDLTGYATQSWVSGELAGYVDTSTYTTDQAAQDARIDQLIGTGMEIPSGADLDTYFTEGLYQIRSTTIAQSLINIPANCKVAGSVEVKRLNTSARIQFYYPNWASSGSNPGAYYCRQRTGTTIWTPWYCFYGTL